jgi:hypothetical protein
MKRVMNIIGFWALASALIGLIVAAPGCKKKEQNKQVVVKQQELTGANPLSQKVKQVLDQKIELLNQFAQDAKIVGYVADSNNKNRELTQPEILILDEKWQKTEEMDDFIMSFITNDCAQYLMDFQDAHDEFPEIFLTDEKGLIVGESNKTSDYYQADEQWWLDAYDQGRGRSYHGQIEYDQSALTEAISIYAPVMDPESKRAVGVLKAVCDITSLKMEIKE